jgi:hypothetical protein
VCELVGLLVELLVGELVVVVSGGGNAMEKSVFAVWGGVGGGG